MADIAGVKSLRDIVDGFLFKYKFPMDDAAILFEHACQCYKDIRVKHGDQINTEYVGVDANGIVLMPKSLLSFLAIGIYINSQLWTFTEKPNLDITEESPADPPSVSDGTGGGSNAYYYTIDWQNRKIFCEGIYSDVAVLKYVGTGISATGDTLAPENMIPVIESYMMWKKSLWNRESRPHARTYKKLYWDEVIAYRHLVQALTHDEVRDILWGVPPHNLSTDSVSSDYDPRPDATVATAATSLAAFSFTANWGAATDATGYYLDISTDSTFSSYLPGYAQKDIGSSTSESVSGLVMGTTYYYRVMSYNATSTAAYSNTITALTQTQYTDWFLPSLNELFQMFYNLFSEGVGGFDGTWAYWTSSEYDNDDAYTKRFDLAFPSAYASNAKDRIIYNTRACRTFTGTEAAYPLRTTGEAGGLVFHHAGGLVYEASPADLAYGQAWSNIDDVALTGTGTIVGTGAANTAAIIAQSGHTGSAAKLCDDLTVTN